MGVLTCTGILALSASMLTDKIIVRVTSTVDRQPMRLSQESFLKLGMNSMGIRQSMLTVAAKWKAVILPTSAV